MYLIIFILGLTVGSFIAALTYRLPRNISISKGFSYCDSCKKPIFWYENIPIVSYLLLLGRCSGCGKKISARYPVIELSTGLLFVYSYHLYAANLVLLVYVVFLIFILTTIFVIDLENQYIPDTLVFYGIAGAVIYNLSINESAFLSNLLSGFVSASFLLVLHLLTRGRGMGLGDVKFAVFGGIVVGLNNLFLWFLISFVSGAVVGIILILLKEARIKDKIPFGPFLAGSLLAVLFWSQNIIDYFNLPFI